MCSPLHPAASLYVLEPLRPPPHPQHSYYCLISFHLVLDPDAAWFLVMIRRFARCFLGRLCVQTFEPTTMPPPPSQRRAGMWRWFWRCLLLAVPTVAVLRSLSVTADYETLPEPIVNGPTNPPFFRGQGKAQCSDKRCWLEAVRRSVAECQRSGCVDCTSSKAAGDNCLWIDGDGFTCFSICAATFPKAGSQLIDRRSNKGRQRGQEDVYFIRGVGRSTTKHLINLTKEEREACGLSARWDTAVPQPVLDAIPLGNPVQKHHRNCTIMLSTPAPTPNARWITFSSRIQRLLCSDKACWLDVVNDAVAQCQGSGCQDCTRSKAAGDQCHWDTTLGYVCNSTCMTRLPEAGSVIAFNETEAIYFIRGAGRNATKHVVPLMDPFVERVCRLRSATIRRVERAVIEAIPLGEPIHNGTVRWCAYHRHVIGKPTVPSIVA